MFGFGKKQRLQVHLPERKVITPVPEVVITKKMSDRSRARTVIGMFLLMGVLVTFFWYSTHPDTVLFNRNEYSSSKSPRDQVIEEIGRQYLLPQGEVPDFAIVTDLAQLQGQQFFEKAQVGDAVLIYMQAKKAILWRPSTRQIIEVGPVSVKEPSPDTTATTSDH